MEDQQKGSAKAGYGTRLLEELSARLQIDFGNGYSIQNLRYIRQFYLTYPELLDETEIHHALRGESGSVSRDAKRSRIRHAVRGELSEEIPGKESEQDHAVGDPSKAADTSLSSPATRERRSRALRQTSGEVGAQMILSAPRKESWRPGLLSPNLSWIQYRALLKVANTAARSFYEIEASKNNWAGRELERQINSLLYERLAKSRDKAGLMRLATRGQEIATPADIFKDPVVIEFLGLPESPRLVETRLEEALINNLQAFLLEFYSMVTDRRHCCACLGP